MTNIVHLTREQKVVLISHFDSLLQGHFHITNTYSVFTLGNILASDTICWSGSQFSSIHLLPMLIHTAPQATEIKNTMKFY